MRPRPSRWRVNLAEDRSNKRRREAAFLLEKLWLSAWIAPGRFPVASEQSLIAGQILVRFLRNSAVACEPASGLTNH